MQTRAKYFSIEEYVPEHILAMRGEARAWELLDPRLLETNDRLREDLGPMIINTWHSKRMIDVYGFRDQSGLRTVQHWIKKGMSSVDANIAYEKSLSQHKFGRASDALFTEVSAEDARRYVMDNKEIFPHLTGLELGVSWFHGDVRNVDQFKTFEA